MNNVSRGAASLLGRRGIPPVRRGDEASYGYAGASADDGSRWCGKLALWVGQGTGHVGAAV
jgi:hypothetical protein